MRLLLIRHAQISSNVDVVLDTSIPGPELTELGFAQADALPVVLDGEDIGAIWVSSALRTHQTAAPVSRARCIVPIERDGIREIAAGDYEMSGDIADIKTYMQTVQSWACGDLSPRIVGGEDGKEFFARYDAVIDEAVRTGHDQGHRTIAVVSHGAAIRCWTELRTDNFAAAGAAHCWLDNTGVVVVEDVCGGGDVAWTCRTWMGHPVSGVGVSAPSGRMT